MSRGGDAKRWIQVVDDPVLFPSSSSSTSTTPGSIVTTLLIEVWHFIASIIENPEEFVVTTRDRAFTLIHIAILTSFAFIVLLWLRRWLRIRACKNILSSQ